MFFTHTTKQYTQERHMSPFLRPFSLGILSPFALAICFSSLNNLLTIKGTNYDKLMVASELPPRGQPCNVLEHSQISLSSLSRLFSFVNPAKS